MQDEVRYIVADFKRGGVTPHRAEEVLDNRYGDCKDQTTLLVAMLRALDIAAYPALLNTPFDQRFNNAVPALNFSHMLVYVPVGGKGLWLDTSGRTTRFPGLDWTIRDRWALVIDGKGGKLLKTPASSATENTGRVNIDFTFLNDRIEGHLTVTATGALSDRLKSAFHLNPDRENVFGMTVKSLYPKARVSAVEFPEISEARVPFKTVTQFEFENIWDKDQSSFSFTGSALPMLSIFTPLLQLPVPHLRKSDYYLGLKYQLEQETRCPAPSDTFQANVLESSASVVTPAFSFTKSHVRGDNAVTMRLKFELNQARISVDEYQQFHAGVQQMLQKSQSMVAYVRKDTVQTAETMKKAVKQSGTTDETLVLVRDLLTKGQYAPAKDLIESVVAKEPHNPEAQYLLGITLGYLDDLEASSKALKKARKLGYRP